MWLLAKFVQWNWVEEAIRKLHFTPKKAAEILEKVVKSAAANAHQDWASLDDLHIESIQVWRGPKMRRIRPVSRWRAHAYNKHRSFVKVILSD